MLPLSLENPLVYCREKVCPDLSSLHYATLFQPETDKAFWLGLFTLNHELRAASIKQMDMGLVQVKLGWWRNALVGALDNSNPHPVIAALNPRLVSAVDPENWPVLIESVVSSCEPRRYNSMADWSHHLGTAITPWLPLIAQRVGLHSQAGYSALRDFWTASTQLCQLLRTAKYLDVNFQPVPLDILRQFNVTAEQIKQRRHDEGTLQVFNEVGRQTMGSANRAWKAMPAELRLFCRPLRTLFRMRVAEFRKHGKTATWLSEQKVLSPLKKFTLAWTTQVLRW